MKIQVRKPTIGKNICPVMKSNQSKSDFPKIVSPSTAPIDKEQKAPITEVEIVTINAAFLRLILISSWINAVLTSWSDIREVSAANDNNMKKSNEIQ